ASDDGASSTDNITSITTPTFSGTAPAGLTVELLANGSLAGTGTADAAGNWSIKVGSPLGNGTYNFTARTRDAAGNTSASSPAVAVSIVASVPTPSTPDLIDSSDTGIANTDNITRITTPTFTGTAGAGLT